MRLHPSACVLALFVTACAAATGAPPAASGAVQHETVGNRVSENIPAIPDALVERLNRYQNTRGARFSGWLGDGGMLITTRFAQTNQVHRVAMPLGMREQLTFYPEPVNSVTTAPVGAPSAAPASTTPATARNGFVFGKDSGGNEFWQLYFHDLDTRETTLLSDGGRSRNGTPLFSRDGSALAYTSTARNGTDSDVWLRGADGVAKPVLTAGGAWAASDFSADGQHLLVQRYVSINDVRPGVLDLATGKLDMFPVDGGSAAFGAFVFAPDGNGAYYTSDENGADGSVSEFRTLRYHDIASGRVDILSATIPWDVQDFRIAADGRHLAFVSNEDGIGRVHVLTLPERRELTLPTLPIGLVELGDFTPDGNHLALTLNSATAPSDVYVLDLTDDLTDTAALTRWTRSEVGGLDTRAFVAPELVRYRSFDGREIPAFYYRPHAANGAPAHAKSPVVIQIHGGPEAQALPSFNPTIQFLVNELKVAVLVPNVRGSAGYGKSYLLLDNAEKREDSVKDIGALLDWIGARPELDATRVGVFGGSYGGYMVLAALTNYPERIHAGVDIVGISSFVTFLNNTESYRRDLRRAEYGDERDPAMRAVLEKISPLNNADRITAPLFVAQGRNDPRVPYTEAEQIVSAVRGNGQDVWYLLFNDEGHGFAKKTNADYFGAATVLFWQRHLLGAGQAAEQ